MEIKEVDTVKKEKIYELTEKELEQIIKSSYAFSNWHLASYIKFCYENYILKMNIFGTCTFLSDLIKFIYKEINLIPNVQTLSYQDYKKNNFYCPWDLNNLDKLMKGEKQ